MCFLKHYLSLLLAIQLSSDNTDVMSHLQNVFSGYRKLYFMYLFNFSVAMFCVLLDSHLEDFVLYMKFTFWCIFFPLHVYEHYEMASLLVI